MYRIKPLKLLQGPAHKKMDMLASELRIPMMRLKAVGAECKLYASCFTIGRLVNRLDHPARTRWFLHRTKHRKQSVQEVFKAWVSLEASAVLKHRYSVVAKKYVKTSRDGVNTKYTSSYGIVVNEIQSAHEEQKKSWHCAAQAPKGLEPHNAGCQTER